MAAPAPSDADRDAYEHPVVALEEALGRSFRPEHLQGLQIDLELCERLYFALRDYHRRNRISTIDLSSHRPNLGFVGSHDGVLVNTTFDGYTPGSFIPRNGDAKVPVDDVKRTLLLADAVVVEDPAFAFCRAVLCHRLQEARPAFHVLHQALLDLAAMRELLEDRLVRLTAYFPAPVENVAAAIPRRAGTMVVGDVTAATSHQDPEVLRYVAGAASDPVKWKVALQDRVALIRELRKAESDDFVWLYQQAESLIYGQKDGQAYGPYLPTDYMYRIFAKLIARNSERSVHPFLRYVTELNSGYVVDPDKIQLQELTDIRRNEEVFTHWRTTVSGALELARAGAEKTDLNANAFRAEMTERQRAWSALHQRYHKGRIADISSAGKEISIGTIGALFTDGPSLGALTSFFTGPLKALDRERLRYHAEGAMVGFFTAVHATAEPPDRYWPGTV